MMIFCLITDPFILPHQQVDKGAIKFVLSGANIMCPGLTSPGAKLYPAKVDTVVVSFAFMFVLFLKFNTFRWVSGQHWSLTAGRSRMHKLFNCSAGHKSG